MWCEKSHITQNQGWRFHDRILTSYGAFADLVSISFEYCTQAAVVSSILRWWNFQFKSINRVYIPRKDQPQTSMTNADPWSSIQTSARNWALLGCFWQCSDFRGVRVGVFFPALSVEYIVLMRSLMPRCVHRSYSLCPPCNYCVFLRTAPCVLTDIRPRRHTVHWTLSPVRFCRASQRTRLTADRFRQRLANNTTERGWSRDQWGALVKNIHEYQCSGVYDHYLCITAVVFIKLV